MYCRLDNIEELEQSLFYAVKDSVLTYSNVLKCMQMYTGDGILSKIVFKVIIVIMYKTHYMVGQPSCR